MPENYSYKVKCRGCGKVTEMYLGSFEVLSYKDFKFWVVQRSRFPIEKQCECDEQSILFHDVISYGIGKYYD